MQELKDLLEISYYALTSAASVSVLVITAMAIYEKYAPSKRYDLWEGP